MKDNLSENKEEKDLKPQETKSLEQRILEDIEGYEPANNDKSSENEETDAKDFTIGKEPAGPAEISGKTSEQPVEEEVKESAKSAPPGESNYQINLINENLLRIKVKTRKGVNIDCSVKDTKSLSETQSNRLYLHPKPTDDIQEVEIIISIDPATGNLTFEKKKDEAAGLISTVLTPNPEVENLIMPVDLGRPEEPLIPLTEDELLEVKIGSKNPFHINRLLYRKNMTIGIISAVVFACVAVFLFYNFYGKNETKTLEPEKRLIVINDIPVKINFKEYEDPNKPKEEPKPEDGSDPNKVTPPVVQRNIIRAPKINRPKINTANDSTLTKDATKELDSLRKVQAMNDSLRKNDSLASLNTAYTIPDSLKKSYSENQIGLSMDYSKNWKVGEVFDKTGKFEGLVLSDTTKDIGTANIFIENDNDGKNYRAELFATKFEINDSASSAYISEAKTIAGNTSLKFYIFFKTSEKIFVNAQIKEDTFKDYRPVVEAIVKSIRILPPPPAPPK